MKPEWAAEVDYDLLCESLPNLDPATVRFRRAPRLMWLIRRLFLPTARAITLPWGVYLHPDVYPQVGSARLLVHELAHVEQWRRLGVVGFLRRYLGDYFRARANRTPHLAAYKSISLEVEAGRLAAFVCDP